uniref:Uncharacterized protein n=1 Tax=Rhizophora mucronata TaxID=61149 RepID=A0A2P2NVQ3_RHIMU
MNLTISLMSLSMHTKRSLKMIFQKDRWFYSSFGRHGLPLTFHL